MILSKIKSNAIATKIYGADGVNYTPAVEKTIAEFEAEGLDKMPICMAKTQYSLSDDQFKLGAPTGLKSLFANFALVLAQALS